MRIVALPLLLILATASTVEAGPRMVFRLEAHGLSPELKHLPEHKSTKFGLSDDRHSERGPQIHINIGHFGVAPDHLA